MSFKPSNTTDELPITPEKAFADWVAETKSDCRNLIDDIFKFMRENKEHIIFPKEPKHNWGTNER